MSVVRGLKRLWLVGAIAWAVFVPLWGAYQIQSLVDSSYDLARLSARSECDRADRRDLDCETRAYAANVAKYGDSFGRRFSRLFLENGALALSGWVAALVAAVGLPPLLIYMLGAILIWIGRGFTTAD